MVGCKPKPEFYIDGIPYYTQLRCEKYHTETKFGYHYGYNPLSHTFEYHVGQYVQTVCDEEKIDTIEINY